MSDAVVESLILELLRWLRSRERSYDEVMDAWRTSCPKLPVWEEANDRGLVVSARADGRTVVSVTPAGRALLDR
jgi:D-3-phosphoglycerate dehydrogenase